MEGSASSVTDVISTLVSAFTTMAGNAMDGIAQILPVVLPILAAIIVIGIVIRIVKRITGGRG